MPGMIQEYDWVESGVFVQGFFLRIEWKEVLVGIGAKTGRSARISGSQTPETHQVLPEKRP